MPIAAVPDYLGREFKDASPGMRFGMYLSLWGINRRSKSYLWETHDIDYEFRGQNREEREISKKNIVSALSDAKHLTARDQKLMLEVQRRQKEAFIASVADTERVQLEAVSTSPFTTGLGNEHPLENGFAFLNPYGLPYLPGSGVKGVMRQAARELACGMWSETHGWNEEKSFTLNVNTGGIQLSMIDALFGLESSDGATDHIRGALTFWDVIPQIKGDSLMIEIMAPHQGHYYQLKPDRKSGDSHSPHDSGQPIPIYFLTLPAGSNFLFHVRCDLNHLNRIAPELAAEGKWKTLLTAAFEHAFQWLGFGAKTAVGYGSMQSEAQRQREHAAIELRKEQERLQQKEATARRQAESATAWPGAQVKFNRGNGTLSVKKDGKEAFAVAPKGLELLESLPQEIRKKIETNQFVRVTAYVAEGVLVSIEMA